jgi:hypothetical protein
LRQFSSGFRIDLSALAAVVSRFRAQSFKNFSSGGATGAIAIGAAAVAVDGQNDDV